ncbi:MAG: lactate racemase domain-containing protein [Erysipelotrichaceae bacterium]|nr:lactate racemase domain-containing protein [Erysipelotrichaceae bacterium]
MLISAQNVNGLSDDEIIEILKQSIKGRSLNNVLIIPPDITRFHSKAGFITNCYYHLLREKGVHVDILPALGTHAPMSEAELDKMFGDIPKELFMVHHWHDDVTKIGTVNRNYINEISEGIFEEDIAVEVNKTLLDEKYDLILSIGQVVPHEVAGMSSHAKNLLVGTGGAEMINSSHMLGAVYGLERLMGKDHSPVRKLYDYAFEHFLSKRPILFVLTVTTAIKDETSTKGLFISPGREAYEKAIELSLKTNLDIIKRPFKKCVVYLDPGEFKSTWLGNKAIYRSRMAMADNGELIILAPGIERFGEDENIDQLIRKYGYVGRKKILQLFNDPENQDLRDNMSAAAHLIHGSSDGRFAITYAVKALSQDEIRSVGYNSASYDELSRIYDPEKLKYGWNQLAGEEIFYIPHPSTGLWVYKKD